MSEVNQLSLFGLDLSGLYRRAALGVHQVLWGDEVGLRAWLSPALPTFQLSELERVASDELLNPEIGCQVLLPEAQVLVTRMTLPASAEIFLEEAAAAHVTSHSPFTGEETCWGSKIVDRSGDALAVEIIIVARSTAEAAATAVRRAFAPQEVPFGLSAHTDRACVALNGYQDAALDAPYLANLKQYVLRLGGALAGTAFLTIIPVIWSLQTAQQYSDLLQETEQRSKQIVAVRGELVDAQERVSEAGRFFSEQVAYRPWLHRLAAVTPDSVYLNRLSIKGNVLTVSGLAVNAADYQAFLVESGIFSDVTAPAAFTLDNRANRERFTLTMGLVTEGAR
ncbi:MAG: PilN domain-containing protein [Luminiphilus sp.]